jgi:hypothetical protein
MWRSTGKFLFGSALFLATVTAASVGHAQQPDKDGFVPLYNGKDLKNWQTTGNWLVEEDGVLAIQPRPGETGWQRYSAYLWTKKKYSDYILDLEYKHNKDGNSGIFVRVKDLKNPVDTGIEVQILDSYGKKGELIHHDNGGVIRTIGPSKNMSKPAGEWNRMIITCKGDNLKVNLNGEQIVDIQLSAGAMKDRPMTGYVGLQDHGIPLWFRNVKIKELK